jgi:hypothetical protein
MSRDGSLPSGCSDLSELQRLVLLKAPKGKRRGIMPLSEAMKVADEEHAELLKVGQTKHMDIYELAEESDYEKHIGKRRRLP